MIPAITGFSTPSAAALDQVEVVRGSKKNWVMAKSATASFSAVWRRSLA